MLASSLERFPANDATTFSSADGSILGTPRRAVGVAEASKSSRSWGASALAFSSSIEPPAGVVLLVQVQVGGSAVHARPAQPGSVAALGVAGHELGEARPTSASSRRSCASRFRMSALAVS